MPTFATPGPIAATVEVAGAQVRVNASDRTDTVVVVEPIDKASRRDAKVADRTKVDFANGPLSVKTIVPGDNSGSGTAAVIDANSERGTVRNSLLPEDPATSGNGVALHARTRHGDIVIQRAAS